MSVKPLFIIPKMFNCLASALAFVILSAFTLAAQASTETEVVYVRPGEDFSQYTQFVVTPLNLSDTKLVPPPWVENPKPSVWKLSKKDIEFIRGLYIDSISKGIHTSGKFKSVNKASEQAIQVDVKITRLTPWAAKGEAEAQTLGSGELAFHAELRDSVNGNLLVIVEGVQQVGKNYQVNKRLNHEHNLKEHFESWGEALSAALAKQHK